MTSSAFARTVRVSFACLTLSMLLLAAFAPAPVPAQAIPSQQENEQRKIEYLISAIADMKDAKFIRNGSEYDAQRAASHLRLKLRFAGSRVKTADDFITCCATNSSMSGEKYWIKFPDGHMVESAIFLREKLAAYPVQEPRQPIVPEAEQAASKFGTRLSSSKLY